MHAISFLWISKLKKSLLLLIFFSKISSMFKWNVLSKSSILSKKIIFFINFFLGIIVLIFEYKVLSEIIRMLGVQSLIIYS